ncbi:MAG: hypothetical protein ACP5QZ_03060 [Candidatus Sumerlaeaceae bacterium]
MTDVWRMIVWGVCLFAGLWMLAFVDASITRVFLPGDEKRLISSTPEGVEFVEAPPPWSKKLLELRRVLASSPHNGPWQQRRSPESAASDIYLRASDPLYSELQCATVRNGRVRYIRFHDGTTTKVLGLNHTSLAHIQTFAPPSLARPLRRLSLVFFGFGWGTVWLIPWRRRAENELWYARGASVVGPLFVGTVLGGTFYFLSLSVPLANGWVEASTNRETYATLSLITLLFTLPAWIIWTVAAHSATFSLRLAPEKLLLKRWVSQREISATELSEARLDERSCPPWLRWIFIVLAILRPRSAGPLLLAVERTEYRLALHTTNGENIRIGLDYLVPLDALFVWFKTHQIPVVNNSSSDDTLVEQLAQSEREHQRTASSVAERRDQILRVILGLTGIAFAVWAVVSLHPVPAISL